ncbi:MAG TPA: hypothetical protein VKI65_13260 [Gemmataceae bacterium]|nr:hypothetical protein [Gemmataceae bacterium]
MIYCCITELFMFWFGLIALIEGRIMLMSRLGEVHGTAARLVGLMLMLPLPLDLLAATALVVIRMAQGEKIDQLKMSNDPIVGILEAGFILGCFVIAVIIGIAANKVERRREATGELDYDYDELEDEKRAVPPPTRPIDERFREKPGL